MMITYKILGIITCVFFILNTVANPASASKKIQGNIGTFEKWHKIEIRMKGPDSRAFGEQNPFAIFVDVTFTSPSGQDYKVPGFYDGNGRGEINGSIWKVRFSADEAGVWRFTSISANKMLDGYEGSFTITIQRPDSPGFYKSGRLEYTGTAANQIRYLKFRDGPYWLKAGCDDPENFLGDSSYYDSPDKRKHAIDYLSRKGVNSLYIMTHNIDGDNNDVWPWLGDTPGAAKLNAVTNARFNIAKLKEWRELFEYMQIRGVVPYIVLEDDSAWTGYDHKRYYQEMIARFGDLPALLFNFGEEYDENYSLRKALSFMQILKDIDPYNHPRGIHNVNAPKRKYVNAPQIDFTAIQTKGSDPLGHNAIAVDWINKCIRLNKRVLMVGFDEPRPLMDRKGWWSAYMAGGVWEVHVDKPYDRPFSAWERAWAELGGAKTFIETLPFWEMEPKNDLIREGKAFCLAKVGEAYALYLPFGGEVTVNLVIGINYDYAWWNPGNNIKGSFENEGRVAGGFQVFNPPGKGDWALRIVRSGP